MKALRLAKNLTFPPDAVTQTFLIVGKRGSGKSNTAARFVEQLHHARLPFVVLDPVDTWWGLKADRDGGKGLDVYVFGGRKQDLPLEAGGGALIAEVLCEHRLSMVLSVKHLSGRERSTFMVDFAQTLFKKWAGGPLHVVLEEAHELAPQNTQNAREGEQQMLGAFKRLWKLGRASGIGGSAITQRPASLSKDITTQSEILIAHRTIGPQDVKAVGEWVKYHGEHLDLLAELPTLPTGEAFVWAPEFPEGKPIGLQRTAILLRETYDSASTPKVGEQRVEPKELADVDLERLRTKMAATIEKAKADDPRELRKQIAELKAQLSKAPHIIRDKGQTAAKPVLTDADRALLEKLTGRITEVAALHHDDLVLAGERLKNALQLVAGEYGAAVLETATRAQGKMQALFEAVSVQKVLGKLAAAAPALAPIYPHSAHAASPRSSQPRRVPPALAPAKNTSPARQGISGDSTLAPGERRILTAVAQFGEVDRGQLTVLVGYKATARDTYISRLASKGFVESGQGRVRVTQAGIDALGADYEPLPTGAALLEFWRGRLPVGEVKVLDVIVAAHPDSISRDDLGEKVGYKPTARDTYVSRLASRRLIKSDGRGRVRASEELFS